MINTTAAWSDLEQHAEHMRDAHISELFEQDAGRYDTLSYRNAQLFLDLSKQRVNADTMERLFKLAEEASLPEWIQRLFSGYHVNSSEDRPALHTALRLPESAHLNIDGQDVSTDVQENLQRMSAIVDRIHSKQWRGYSGRAMRTVVNIGVGGSDLGPLMASHALQQYEPDEAKDLAVEFVSTIDGSQLATLLADLDPQTTLFILCSKSFSTIDTLANADTALEWLVSQSGASEEIIKQQHFIGVSCKPDKMSDWGIAEDHQLQIWDWVGGRYSMWSTIGLSSALRFGIDGFKDMLAGAYEMDEHFRTAPMQSNLPVLLALIEIWNINFLDIHAHAILPYDGRLGYLPSYLEQLEMESNGKSVTRDGSTTDYHTCPILWGEVGPNAQHAFYQLLHQGTEVVMCDFIAPASRKGLIESDEFRQQHDLTLANFLAQSRILALGDKVLEDAEQAPAHKRYKGNQPCSTILLDDLNPFSFGQLVALYEHKVYAASVIWDINPFDQWGVELGKKVATELMEPLVSGVGSDALDESTRGLIEEISRLKHNTRVPQT